MSVPASKRQRNAYADGPLSLADALPTDILILIFALAPVRARLRSISLVCKRWRIAALRSVTHFQWPLLPVDGEAMMPRESMLHRVLQLFPSLTSLRINSNCAATSLPTTLRSLHIGSSYYSWLAILEPKLLAVHFPLLSSLSIDGVDSERDVTHVVAFVSRHSLQLAHIGVTCSRNFWDALMRSGASFPRLHTLDLARGPLSEGMLSQDPFPERAQLQEVCVDVGPELGKIPPGLFPYIVRLKCTLFRHVSAAQNQQREENFRTLLGRMPKLRRVELSQASLYLPWLINERSNVYLYASVFELRAFTNIETLSLEGQYQPDGLPVSVRLPFLHSLHLQLAPSQVCEAIRFFLPPRSPRLQHIHIQFPKAIEVAEEEREAIIAVLWEAMQRGVTQVICDVLDVRHRDLAFATQFGWLALVPLPQQEKQPDGMDWLQQL